MVTRRWAPRLHKWIALVVGIQLLAWSASGLFMTVVPISQVRGEHNIRKQETVDLRGAALVPIATVLERAPAGAVARVELRAVAGRRDAALCCRRLLNRTRSRLRGRIFPVWVG
jgi:hypothetical protein